jgi:hypothetical protein
MSLTPLHRLAWLLPLSLLAACASTQGPNAAVLPPLAEGEGRIVFYRGCGVLGSALRPQVRLAGETVGRAFPSAVFFVDRAPGTYPLHFDAEIGRGPQIAVAAGETVYVELAPNQGVEQGRLHAALRPAEEGRQAVAVLPLLDDPRR